MLALLLTCAIFLFWLVVGRAAICGLGIEKDGLRYLLLAPSLGMGILLLVTFLLNTTGLPVRTFGPALTILLGVASASMIAWRGRPTSGDRAYLPFLAVIVIAGIAVGWPMLQLGFGWLSFGNDDMTNYVLLAQRQYESGFFAPPDIAAAVNGQDYTAFYWPMHVMVEQRPGSETLLAWAMSITRLGGYAVFMPVTIAMQMSLTSAVGAMVFRDWRRQSLALVACACMAVSALTALGTTYQLIAQIGGLALTASLVAVTFVELPPARLQDHARFAGLAALLGAALLVQYPEITPFFGLAFFLYVGHSVLRRRTAIVRTLLVLAVAVVGAALILNEYVLRVGAYLLNQTTSGLSASPPSTSLFPDFMVPSGLAALWGFQSILDLTGDPWLSISIALGAVLLACVTALGVYLVWKREPAAYMALVMVAIGVKLFLGGVDFGLFKLTMYAQPFLVATLATGVWLLLWRPAPLRFVLLGLIAAAGLPGLISYPARSVGPFNAVAYGSQMDVEQQFNGIARSFAADPLVSDTQNDVMGKMEAYFGEGAQLVLPSRDLFSHFVSGCGAASVDGPPIFQELRNGLCSTLRQETFDLHPTDASSPAQDSFQADAGLPATLANPSCKAVLTDGTETIFNRLQSAPGGPNAYQVQPCADVTDHLMFVDSSQGQDYYFGEQPSVGLYQLEGDPFFPNASMAGVGQYLLFQVLGPTPSMRIMVDMTSSMLGDGTDQLPSAAVVGAERTPMPYTGSGAGRVVSAIVTPQIIDGSAYLALDMGESGRHLPEPRRGLAALYGQDYHRDYREIVGFARNISLISDADYQRIQPPTTLRSFPADLGNPQLEYSGMFEDGWVSSSSFFRLSRPDGDQVLTIQGMLPRVDDPSFHTTMQVLADGAQIGQADLQPGTFNVSFPVPVGDDKPRIDLRFSASQTLPAPDRRPVAVLLKSIGIEQQQQLPSKISSFPSDLESSQLNASGIYDDGWVSNSASVSLNRPAGDQVLTIQGSLPLLHDPSFHTTLQVLADGAQIGQADLQPGTFNVSFPVPAGDDKPHIDLRFSATQTLPAPDGRSVSVLLKSMGIEQPPPLPSQISSFPSDLNNPQLGAAGIYDDGWVSNSASVSLSRPAGDQVLTIRGSLPLLNDPSFHTTLQVLADGTQIGQADLQPGTFNVSFPVPAGDDKPRIDLRFSAAQTLPAPDGRSASILLTYLGF